MRLVTTVRVLKFMDIDFHCKIILPHFAVHLLATPHMIEVPVGLTLA